MIARFVCLFVFCGSLFAQQSSQTSLTPLSPGFRGGAARGCSGSEVRRKGRVRFCRRNDDGQIDFTGENVIDHTARDETVRIYPGNAFDLTGERRRTNYIVEIGKSTDGATAHRAQLPNPLRLKFATTRKSRSRSAWSNISIVP